MTDKARELLDEALSYTSCESWSPSLTEEIRAYLAEPEVKRDDEPIGYVYSEYGSPRKNVALSNDSIPNGTPVYLHPAPREFVRLSEDEIESLANSGLSPNWTDEFELYHFARAVETALMEKNNV